MFSMRLLHSNARRVVAVSLTAASFLATTASAAVSASEDIVGEVRFETSCEPAVHADFNRAVALLHSFEFADARRGFSEIVSRDEGCAMAQWGIAMTYYHPLWAPPTEAELDSGLAAVERAERLAHTPRERDYIAAIAAFYRGDGAVDHRSRAVAYERAMADVYARNGDDPEAKIFYALAILSNADPTDKTYRTQKRSGGMLEPLFADMPHHPGLAHYIIHSYDFPSLAERAVEAAHRYLDIAPSLPHALHMSAHIFTRLGMWDDSIRAPTRFPLKRRGRVVERPAHPDKRSRTSSMHSTTSSTRTCSSATTHRREISATTSTHSN